MAIVLCVWENWAKTVMWSHPESCALDAIGATFLRDVEPGEIVTIDEDGMHSSKLFGIMRQNALCIFEFIYIARPDSNIDGINVEQARRLMGRELAKEAPLDVDVVISVPDSGTTAAIGYAEEGGIPFTQGILKNRYTGRSFIQPTQEMREQMVKLEPEPNSRCIGRKTDCCCGRLHCSGYNQPQIGKIIAGIWCERSTHVNQCASR